MEESYELDKLVEEVENGKIGKPSELKDKLGEERYNQVQERILEKFEDKTIEEIVNEVVDKAYGNGEERQLKLGLMYEMVQNKVNEEFRYSKRRELNDRQIEIMAYRTIDGEFGNGMERKRKLGKDFKRIQNKVNEINGSDRRYNLDLLPLSEYEHKLYIKEMTDEDVISAVGKPTFCFIRNKVNEILEKKNKNKDDIKDNENKDEINLKKNDKRGDRCKITKECIDELAEWTIMLEFDENEERKKRLGELYPFVQNRVNEILNCPTRHDISKKPWYLDLTE